MDRQFQALAGVLYKACRSTHCTEGLFSPETSIFLPKFSILLWKCTVRNAWGQRKASLYMGVSCHRYPVHTGTATHLKAKICLAACCLPSQIWRVSFAMCSQVWCSLCQSPPSLSARYCCMYSARANSASQNPLQAACKRILMLAFPG